MDDVRAIIKEMLGTLGQSHFVLIEKETLSGGDKSEEGSPAGTVGFDIRMRSAAALVTRVEPESPGEKSGVQLGWKLISIDGTPIEEIVKELPVSQTLRPVTAHRRGVLAKIDGPVGSQVQFTFEAGLDKRQTSVELTRVERDAVPFDLPGLPTFYLTLRTDRFEHADYTIGVLHFSNWFRGIIGEIDEALFSMRDCDAIVIDLRGNSGGEGLLARRVAGHFFNKKSSLGTQIARRGEVKYSIRPRRTFRGKKIAPFTGPLVILSDETTGSCSEVFTGGMQALGRARVMGERSAGAGLPATLTRLPNDDFLLHAIGNFITARGVSLEGDGVQPDQVVLLQREALLGGRDGVLDAAARWIGEELDTKSSAGPSLEQPPQVAK